MVFEVKIWDIGMLAAGCSLAALLVSEVISPHYGRTNITLNLKRLRFAAAGLVLMFVAIAIVNVVTDSIR